MPTRTVPRIVQRPVDGRPESLFPRLHPVLARVYAGRRVGSPVEVDYALARLLPYTGLEGIDRAAALLAEAVTGRRRILVVGDFDADGATACAAVVLGLRAMGADAVDYLVPDRFRFGYGLTPGIVEVAAARAPHLIVTVDNGTSSHEGVAAARARGIRVVVTDHHLPGAQLPAADAIVNPNQPGDRFASKSLAGVGVAFYVLSALRAHLRERAWFGAGGRAAPRLADLLDLVALGTVADVVPLDHNNRILVAQGLARIRAGRCRPGITALLRVAGRDPARAASSDLAYAVAPRLNAAGRLQDMSVGIECLLSEDGHRTGALARELDRINAERREIEATMQAEALAHVDALALEAGDALPRGLCLYQEDWHPGVVGLVASRIKERVGRPVIAFAPGDGGELKGSARSVPGLHVRDALDAVATRHPGMLKRFGGHAMAAGLSLDRAELDAFREAFDEAVRAALGDAQPAGTVLSDGGIAPVALGLELAETLRRGGPWGQSFPEPVFDDWFRVAKARVVGERHVRLALRPDAGAGEVAGIAFGLAGEPALETGARVRLVYRLDVNDYAGLRSAQLVVEHAQPDGGA